MKTIKILAAFIALAALGRAETADRPVAPIIVQLPPVVVTASRLPNPSAAVAVALDEARAQVVSRDLVRRLDRAARRLALLRRNRPIQAGSAAKPNV